MKLLVLFVLFFVYPQQNLTAQEVEFITSSGSKVFPLGQLEKITPSQKITVWEPHEKTDVSYQGFPINKLFEHAFGKNWSDREAITFTCVDGYQPTIPLDQFTKYAAYLVFKRHGSGSFKVNNKNQNEKNIDLGPFYLVWDNKNHPELKEKGASGWPYQVAKMQLSSFEKAFPKMAPPKSANPDAKAGFILFRERCQPCHTMNGQGGKKAPELNYPVSVTEYMNPKWIRQYIMDPRSIRYNSTMPAFKEMPNHKKFVAQVMAYLAAMATHKVEPD